MEDITDGLVSAADCAGCKQCCFFESYTLADTPTVSDDVAVLSAMLVPEVRFTEPYGRRLFMMLPTEDKEIFVCPMLDHSSGCKLGGKKPFECRLFPFALMGVDGKRMITLSPSCPCIGEVSFGRLKERASALLKDVLAEADERPELVRPYEAGYIVMCVEKSHRQITPQE